MKMADRQYWELTVNIAVTRLLLVRDPWATLLLSGHKKWEIRSEPVRQFGTVAIAKSGIPGEHKIYGILDIAECKGPLSRAQLRENLDLHCDPADARKPPYPKTYAWVVQNPRFLRTPVDYVYKSGWIKWGKGNWVFTDEDFFPEVQVASLPSPDPVLRARFLESLCEDLSFFEMVPQISQIEGRTVSTVLRPAFSQMADDEAKRCLQQGYTAVQDKNRNTHKQKLDQIKEELTTEGLLAESPCNLEELNPIIECVNDKSKRNIHWWCRMQQNIPSARSIGKSLDILIYNNAGDSCHLIGAVGLGSPGYTSGGRDTLFGWDSTTFEGRLAKEAALKCIVQINCIVTVPPYTSVPWHLSKLLAMAVFSSEIVNGYSDRHGSPLLAAISTCGFGMDAPLFHRIALGNFPRVMENGRTAPRQRNPDEALSLWSNPDYVQGARRNRKNHLYYREASTSDVCMNIVSDATKELAVALCESAGSVKRMSSRPQALTKALQYSGIHEDVFRMRKRGIYVGMLSNDYITALSKGKTRNVRADSIPWSDLSKQWVKNETNRLDQLDKQ